jgi:hypothetical protein
MLGRMTDNRWVRVAIAALAAALTSAACATTAADFRLETVRPDEAAVVGKLDVVYNGQRFTQNCSITLGGAVYQLDASGLVFVKVKRGTHDQMRLACLDKSAYHYDFEGLRFDAHGGGLITYFGNATVNWQTDGGLKLASMFGAIGAAIDASSNDGRALMAVVDEPEPVRAAFVKRVGASPRWVTRLLKEER